VPTLKEILESAAKLPVEEVGAFGQVLRVGRMPSCRKDGYDQATYAIGTKAGCTSATNFRARLVAWSLCDEAGGFLCIDPEADAESLGKSDPAEVNRLYQVAKRLNGIGKDAEDEAEKN
jgi:hypothetical protein